MRGEFRLLIDVSFNPVCRRERSQGVDSLDKATRFHGFVNASRSQTAVGRFVAGMGRWWGGHEALGPSEATWQLVEVGRKALQIRNRGLACLVLDIKGLACHLHVR